MCINLIKPQNSLFVCLFTNKQTYFSYGHSPNTCLCKKDRHPDFAEEEEVQHENLVENITAACKKVWPAQVCDDAGDGNDDEYEEESDEAEEDTIPNHH